MHAAAIRKQKTKHIPNSPEQAKAASADKFVPLES